MKKLILSLCLVGFTLSANAQSSPVFRVNTLAAAIANPILSTNIVFIITGRSSPGDGTAGLAFYDPGSSATTNTYMVFKPTSTTGRIILLPTSFAVQNAAVTVADDSTYAWKLMRAGQTNFLGFGADNNSAFMQSFNGKPLRLNPVAGNTITLNEAGGALGIGTTTPLNDVNVSRTLSGGNVVMIVDNLANTASSGSVIASRVAGTSAKQAVFWSLVSGGTTWAWGIDAANARWKLANTTDLQIGTSLTVDTNGNAGAFTAIPLAPWHVTGASTFSGSITNYALSPSLPVFTGAGTNLVSQTAAASKTLLGIQFGTSTTAADGTGTNTFGTAFASAPIVVTTPTGAAAVVVGTNKVISTSATAFIYVTGAPGTVINWIANGAP